MTICPNFWIREEEEMTVAILFRYIFNMDVFPRVLHNTTLDEVAKMFSLTPEETRFLYAALLLRRAMLSPIEGEYQGWFEDFKDVMRDGQPS